MTAPLAQDWNYLSWTSVQAMMTKTPSTGSLSSFYSWQQFLIAYFTNSTAKLSKYEQSWGPDFATDNFLDGFRARIETVYFGGGFADIAVSKLLLGFQNAFAAGVSSGDYLQGNDFSLTNYTTPMMNDQVGFGSTVTFGLFTGTNDASRIGNLRIVNGAAYANKVTEINNGTALVNVTQHDGKTFQSLYRVSEGLVFPPMSKDETLRVFDQRNIQVMNYTQTQESDLGGDGLKVVSFKGTSHGNDVGFAFNLPVYEKPFKCYGCQQNFDQV